MAQLQWNTIQNQANNLGSDYVEQVKGFIQDPAEAMNVFNFGSQDTTPQEYFSEEWANKMFNSQMGMFEKLTQQQDEINQLKEQNIANQEKWLSEKEKLVGSYSELLEKNSQYSSSGSTSSNPVVQDYRSASKVNQFKPSKWQQQDTQEIVYDTFRKRGLNHNQALGLLMNIQAENDFGDKYIFGTHQDGAKTAYGMLSWQGGREVPLLQKLSSEGLYDANTKRITQNERAIQIQADYVVDELKSGKQGNYLNFTGSNPLDYARYANKSFTRSSQKANVLQGREKSYQRLLQNRDWNMYLNSGSSYEPRKTNMSEPMANTSYSNWGKGKVFNFDTMNYGGAMTSSIFGSNAAPYTISSGFGNRDTGIKGASKYHAGMDIATPIGTKLYSPFEQALVIDSAEDSKSGRYITIQDQKTGNYLQLLHNSKLNFVKGQTVTNKDVLALSGNTGIGSGAHVDMRMWNKEGYAMSADGKVHNYRHKRLGRG